ncbi:hypothetical protein ACP275_09G138300 [Erythranthe tilingii]
MSVKDAVRTSILSTRWRYLWMFIFGTLEFDDREFNGGDNSILVKRKKFKARLRHVLKLHQGGSVDSLIIQFTNLRSRVRSSDIDSWIYFAMHKDVKRFELNLSFRDGFKCDLYDWICLSVNQKRIKRFELNLLEQEGFHCCYKFPNMEKLLSHSHEVKSVFGSLRSLRLVDVDIEDEVVQYFLASCPYIEHLCIRASQSTKNLKVVDPLLNLNQLEISDCVNLESLEISVKNLVSCTYQGREISSPFKKTPNLTELTLGGEFCQSFIFEPNKHSSYSVQLVKLVLNVKTRTPERTTVPPDLPQLYSLKRLELNIVSVAFRSLFFFMSLIKASPNLQEFKMKIAYLTYNRRFIIHPEVARMPFPDVTRSTYEGFCHKNLKVVEMSGLMGYTTEAEFIIELLSKVAPSIEMVLFDTRTDYCHFNPLVDIVTAKEGAVIMYNFPGGRAQTKIWARKVKKICPSRINFVIT